MCFASVNDKYLDYYEQIKAGLGHYFRTVYRIIRLVDETELDFEDKYKYVSILRAQLSDYEMLWLFYNCLCEYGQDKFKPLVEEYAFFKNLPKHEIHNQFLLEGYNKSAFGEEG